MIEYENLQKANQPFFEEYKATFERVLQSGWFILGKEVESFKRNLQSTVQLISVLVLPLDWMHFRFP